MQKRNISISGAIALMASLSISPPASANGFIFIDPAFHPAPMMPVTPITTITPVTPANSGRPTPGLRRTTLHGTVTTGIHLDVQDISVEIRDQVAKTYIKQTFVNDTNRDLAGTYLFPLPQDATFSSFTLHIDGKPVEGKILAAAEATAQYEQIVRSMVDPGLLEYVNYKTVRARIFPIPANGSKTVELEYTQILPAESGESKMYKYRFPLKSAGADAVGETSFNFDLKSKEGLRTIWSPTHDVKTKREDGNHARINFLSKGEPQEKDFLLYYTVSDKELSANLIAHKKSDENGFFMLTLNPPLKSKKVMPKDIVLVADTSGSMRGEKMDQSRAALKYVIDSLNTDDRFSLVQFNTDADAMNGSLLIATAENKKKACDFIDELEARGGTNIGDALATGVNILEDKDAGDRPAYLILMTDGEPTVGKTGLEDLLKVVSSKRDLRLFDFGVGYDVNTKLLNKLAQEHHGTSQYVEPDENLESAMSSFYAKIKNPVLSDVKISYDGIDVKDIYPKEVKDIFAGSQVLLLGRYKEGGSANLKLTGRINGVEKAYSFPLSFSKREIEHSYLPRIWAMRRISYLTDVAQNNDCNTEVVDEIVELSKRYGIISAYTSFLSTDPNEGRGRPPGSSGPQPFNMEARGFVSDAISMDRLSALPAGRIVVRQSGADDGFASTSKGLAGTGGLSSMFVFSKKHQVAMQTTGKASITVAGTRLGFEPNSSFGKADQKAEKESFARALAFASVSGKNAVALQKALSNLRTDTSSGNANGSRQVKVIGDKTFYLINGFWVDSSFEKVQEVTLKNIEFGSSAYFDLARENKAIVRYLGAGPQLIVVLDGQCYRITSASNSTG